MFATLPPFVCAQVFDFLHGVQLAATVRKVCQKFNATAQMDLIWRNQCVRGFTFAQRRAELNENWLACYRRKILASKKMEEGVSSVSYVMTPLRAHKHFITAVTAIGDVVISGDVEGSVRAWVLDASDYEDGDPQTIQLYRFKKCEFGPEMATDDVRVRKVWILEGKNQYGDMDQNSFTVVAYANHQIAVLHVPIEGYIPPKIEEYQNYLKHHIIIQNIENIDQVELIETKSNNGKVYLLMAAPNFGFALPGETQLETMIQFYNIDTGQQVAAVDGAEAAGLLNLRQGPGGGFPFFGGAMPIQARVRMMPIVPQMPQGGGVRDLKPRQMIKLHNSNELVYALNNGYLCRLNLNTFKINHGKSTQLLGKDTIVQSIQQDPAGQFLYIVVTDPTTFVNTFIVLHAKTSKLLVQTPLAEPSPYGQIVVAHYEIQDIELHKFKLESFLAHRGYLILLLCNNRFFKAMLHITTPKQVSDEEQKKQEVEGVEYTHHLEMITRNEKLSLFDSKEMQQLGGIHEFLVFGGNKVVTAFEADIANINELRTGRSYYALRGGSKTVHPKSYVKNPERDGFAYLSLTEGKVVGARGNLIRVYSFDAQKE